MNDMGRTGAGSRGRPRNIRYARLFPVTVRLVSVTVRRRPTERLLADRCGPLLFRVGIRCALYIGGNGQLQRETSSARR